MTDENNEIDDYSEDHYTEDDSYVEAESHLDDESYEEDDYQDEDFEDDQQSAVRSNSSSRKKKRRMFCRGCNRMESHRRANKKSWLNSYVTGLCFGLNRVMGPFKCTCCGTNRWLIRLKKNNAVTIKR